MKQILILGVAAVQMDAVLQLKKMGCETYTCAMAKDGPAADLSDHFDIINILDEEKIAEHIRLNNIDAVYSTGSDLAMPVACRLSEQLDLPHFVKSKTAYICNHKNVMRTTLKDYNGNVPFQVMTHLKKIQIPYPLIMKPSDTQGQRGIFLVNSDNEVAEHFEEVKNFLRKGKSFLKNILMVLNFQ